MAANEDRAHQSADALKALAEGGNDDVAEAPQADRADQGAGAEDALAALASGDAQGPGADAGAGNGAGRGEFAGLEPPSAGPAGRGYLRETMRNSAAQGHGLHFRKTLIPLLLAMGVLLLLLSGVTTAVLLFGENSAVGDLETGILRKRGPTMVLAALPLACALLAGAWWMHLEVRRAGKG